MSRVRRRGVRPARPGRCACCTALVQSIPGITARQAAAIVGPALLAGSGGPAVSHLLQRHRRPRRRRILGRDIPLRRAAWRRRHRDGTAPGPRAARGDDRHDPASRTCHSEIERDAHNGQGDWVGHTHAACTCRQYIGPVPVDLLIQTPTNYRQALPHWPR